MTLHIFKSSSDIALQCAKRARREQVSVQALAYRLERAKVIRQTLLACGIYV